MPIEKSAGAVIFRKQEGKIYYLLLHYPTNTRTAKEYWGFSKGHIEKGEKPEVAAKREIKEETGLIDIKFLEGFKSWIKYFFKDKNKIVMKIVIFYLAETKNKEVKISSEHIGYVWLPYEQALIQITFQNAKKTLKKANDFVSKKSVRSC